jgi:PHP family Zn ribbon phosphoesterase
MTPQAIVTTAISRGIDLIAITDHNTCAMGDVVARIAEREGLSFLYGIELQTREEVHLLAYFDDAVSCSSFSEMVYALLPDIPNDPEYFSDQVIVDEEENIVRVERKLLLNSIDLSLEELTEQIRAHDGLAVPAHVDRRMFGLIEQLGFFPEGLFFPLVEVMGDRIPPECENAVVIRSSDAHDLEQIGRRTTVFTMMKASIEEILLAAASVDGRAIRTDLSIGGVRE